MAATRAIIMLSQKDVIPGKRFATIARQCHARNLLIFLFNSLWLSVLNFDLVPTSTIVTRTPNDEDHMQSWGQAMKLTTACWGVVLDSHIINCSENTTTDVQVALVGTDILPRYREPWQSAIGSLGPF